MKFFVVLVFVVSSRLVPPSDAVFEAVREVAPPSTLVLTREVLEHESPPEAEVVRTATALQASMVVVVSGASAAVRIRAYQVETRTWVDRELRFAISDNDRDRARTIGFAIASLVALSRPVENAGEPPSKEGEPSKESIPTHSVILRPLPHWKGELAFVGSGGIGGDAGGIGGAVGIRWALLHRLWLRSGGSLRFGQLDVAPVDTSALRLDLGLSWSFFEAAALNVGLRLDAIALRHSVRESVQGDEDARWIPGMLSALEVEAPSTGWLALALAAGGELAFGTTRVFANRAQARIPPLRIYGEVGVRIRF